MNRQIKFRVFDPQQKRMIYLSNGDMFDTNWLDHHNIIQFTGLLDKNGKEIYQSDLIKTSDGILLVVWHEQFASFGLRKDGWLHTHFFGEAVDPKDCEVIGNIHENPELLEGGKA